MKNRMSVADCRRMVAELQEQAVGRWLHNIYDLNSKTFVMKLSVPEKDKVMLLVESGVRFHVTKFSRDKSNIPSGFSMKLRKHIRGKKLSAIRQIGLDRVIDFVFGFGDTTHHLILELYASGNIILTDKDYTILSLLRTHTYDESVRVAVRETYPMESPGLSNGASCASNGDGSDELSEVNTKESVASMKEDDENNTPRGQLVQNSEKGSDLPYIAMPLPAPYQTSDQAIAEAKNLSTSVDDLKEFLSKHFQEQQVALTSSKTAKQKKASVRTLKQTLSSRDSQTQNFGSDLLEHCILKAGLLPNLKITEDFINNEDKIKMLALALDEGPRILESLGSMTSSSSDQAAENDHGVGRGYILLERPKKASKVELENEEEEKAFYSSFEPFRFLQNEKSEKVEFSCFNDAVDEYFSKIEAQREQKHINAARETAMKRVNKIKSDQEKRLEQLKDAVVVEARKAELVSCNLQDVDNAILVVRSAIASGMDWEELSQLVKREKHAGNPVASLIHGLKLEENKITLLLWDELNDDAQQPALKVDVDINLSAHANIRELYANRKRAAEKASKTVEAATKAFEDAKKKTEKTLQKQLGGKKTIQVSRKVLFFEKFNWFVSSDGYLVLSGRDAQQNELIVKRYMRQSHGDVYVHADLHGASSCVVRNLHASKPIPLDTLLQAGTMTVCRSSAWDAKILTSAWWVHANQVSKTAPTGEYLPTGSFMIRGKKNFLAASRLEMGFGYIFRFDETQLSEEELLAKREKEWRMMTGAAVSAGGSSGAEGHADKKVPEETNVSEIGSSGDARVVETNMSEVASSADTNITEGMDHGGPPGEVEGTDRDEGVPRDVGSQVEGGRVSAKGTGEGNEEECKMLGTADATPARDEDAARAMDVNEDEATVDALEEDEAAVENRDSATTKHVGKPRMSAKQRRELRKARKSAQTGSQEQGNMPLPVEKQISQKKKNSKGAKESKGPVPKQLPRGKRSKMKKIAKKYAHQDEEERRLAMLALGNPLQENDEDDTDMQGETDEGLVDGKKQHSKQQRWPKKENVRKIADDIDPEIKAELDGSDIVLRYFTAKPDESDGLIHAIPFCGPYAAMSHFKYRVKLTPGSMKRGRAVRSAQDLLLKLPKATGAEIELIKQTTDPENMQTILGGVKISAPGFAALQKQQKGKFKKGKSGKRK